MKWRLIAIGTVMIVVLILVIRTCTSPPNQGERLYNSQCASCHMEDGSGLGKAIPPLAQADYLTIHRDQFACIVRNGLNDTIRVNGVRYTTPMQGHPTLTEVQITNIANYIYTSWGNNSEPFTIKEIENQLSGCE